MSDSTAWLTEDNSAGSPAPTNKQARATVAILNTVRWLTVAVFGIGVVLGGLGFLVSLLQGEGQAAIISLAVTLALAVYGALAYAFIGWLVDTLDMLTQIARNTAA